MDPVFTKLNLKDQNSLVVLGAPVSFERALSSLKGVRVMRTAPSTGSIPFALAFATTQPQVDAAVRQITPRAADDITLWFAYPKQTSMRVTCEFNQDTGWAALAAAGFEPVRQVSIDDDWAALRFRRAEFIKTLRREPEHAVTEEGRARVAADQAAANQAPAAAKPAAKPPRKPVAKKPAKRKSAAKLLARKKPAPKKPAKKAAKKK